MKSNKKLFYFVTEDWYFSLHWLHIAVAAQTAGFDVSVVTRVRDHGDAIRDAGLTLIPFENSRQGMNVFHEIYTVVRLARLFRSNAPDLVHNVAMKPTLYGSLACRLGGIDAVVCTLAGMGWLFTSGTLVAKSLKRLITFIFRHFLANRLIILQNNDDSRYLKNLGLNNVRVVRGAGVDTSKFFPREENAGTPLVILPARMLWDKGIQEFVEAAKILKGRGVAARFVLVGGVDPGNPAAIAHDQLEQWSRDGIVEWWGQRNDMAEVYRQAHVVCLPSYREGLPTVLTEAASCGRPIVTTDTVGCREVVQHGGNGFLVSVGSVPELADALQRLIENGELRQSMGLRGREISLREFAVERVVSETLRLYSEVVAVVAS